MLKLLDIFFSILHLSLVAFNLFGWIFPATRKAHFITICLTAASWFILGIWYGIGYCPITDWQWQVKEKLGETNLPGSFIKYFADKTTGKNFEPSIVDRWTAILFALVIIIAFYFRFHRWRLQKTSH